MIADAAPMRAIERTAEWIGCTPFLHLKFIVRTFEKFEKGICTATALTEGFHARSMDRAGRVIILKCRVYT